MESGMAEISLEKARAAKKTAVRRFKKLGRVIGVGITRVDGEYAVKLNLSEPVGPEVSLPSDIDGVRLCVEVTGVIRSR
jgi:hypothetical protein